MKKVLIVLFLSFMFITNVKAEDLGLTESAKKFYINRSINR